MNIILYRSSAERIKVDKTPQLEEFHSLEGNMKGAESILSPVITINLGGLGVDVVDNDGIPIEADGYTTLVVDVKSVTECNYMYIPDFKRYYFIDSITLVNDKLYSLECSVDVLMSFKDEIGELDALVERNENDYNILLPDSELTLSYKPTIRIEQHWETNLLNDGTLPNEYTYVASCVTKRGND